METHHLLVTLALALVPVAIVLGQGGADPPTVIRPAASLATRVSQAPSLSESAFQHATASRHTHIQLMSASQYCRGRSASLRRAVGRSRRTHSALVRALFD